MLSIAAGFGIFRKRNNFRGTKEIGGHIAANGLHGGGGPNHLQNDGEHHDGGKESAGGGNREWAKHVIEEKLPAVAESAPTRGQITLRQGLRGGDFDAHGEISRGNRFGGLRKQDGEFAIWLQLTAAGIANFQVFANQSAFADTRRTASGVVHITS